MTGKELASKIAFDVNDLNLKEFCEAMTCQHRTYQQSFTRLCVAWIQKLAEQGKQGYFDMRNQASVELAQEIVEKVDGTKLILPFL